MPSLSDQILEVILNTPGLTDREITNLLRGWDAPQQPVNQAAHALRAKGFLVRKRRADNLIGNFIGDSGVPTSVKAPQSQPNHDLDALSEDEIKEVLVGWLSKDGWNTKVAWGKLPGIDIDAQRGPERWIIEVKGPGSRPPMRVNYFLGILGETLQRMTDPSARYSIALPDLKQYRGLWERFPKLAKSRTSISLLLVSKSGQIESID